MCGCCGSSFREALSEPGGVRSGLDPCPRAHAARLPGSHPTPFATALATLTRAGSAPGSLPNGPRSLRRNPPLACPALPRRPRGRVRVQRLPARLRRPRGGLAPWHPPQCFAAHACLALGAPEESQAGPGCVPGDGARERRHLSAALGTHDLIVGRGRACEGCGATSSRTGRCVWGSKHDMQGPGPAAR